MTVFSVDEELCFRIIHIFKLNKVVASKIGFLETQISRNQWLLVGAGSMSKVYKSKVPVY